MDCGYTRYRYNLTLKIISWLNQDVLNHCPKIRNTFNNIPTNYKKSLLPAKAIYTIDDEVVETFSTICDLKSVRIYWTIVFCIVKSQSALNRVRVNQRIGYGCRKRRLDGDIIERGWRGNLIEGLWFSIKVADRPRLEALMSLASSLGTDQLMVETNRRVEHRDRYLVC